VFDRFTELAKRAIVASEDAALSLRHDFIGTGHLLLGLISTAGTAGEVLRQHGVELSRARDVTVRQLEAAGAPATGGQAARDALSMIGIDVYEIQRRADAIFGPGHVPLPPAGLHAGGQDGTGTDPAVGNRPRARAHRYRRHAARPPRRDRDRDRRRRR
jgi:hypothetical protein